MRLAPAKGTALRCHRVMVRFATGCKPGPKTDAKLAPRVVEVRRLLRTDKSIDEIADDLGVSRPTLVNFIRRRRICNMQERAYFISMQESLRKLDRKAGVSA